MSGPFQISERQLEDFFCAAVEDRLNWKVLNRQLRLDCGVVDAFVLDRERFWPNVNFYRVVELKVEPLKARDLTQVLSYVCELKSRFPDKNISGVLIGPNIRDRHLLGCLRHLSSGEPCAAVASYGLYSFSPLSGIEFDWVSPDQEGKEARRVAELSSRTQKLIDAKRGAHLAIADNAPAYYGDYYHAE